MGIKRLGRKRLAAIEKKGALQDIGASNVMKPAIISATQHREGHKKITDIVVDLGASSANLKSGGTTANLPIGKAGSAAADVSYLCKVTDATFGIVTSLKVVCLEPLTDGLLTQYNLVRGESGNGYLGSADTTNATTITDGSVTGANKLGTLGLDTLMSFDNQLLKNKYIYVGSGAAAGTNVPATCKISNLPENIDEFVADLSILTLQKAKGTDAHYSMVVDTASTPTPTPNKLMLNGAGSREDIADRIVAAVNKETSSGAAHGMVATKGSGPDFDVTVTQDSTTGADGNLANVGMSDAPGKNTGITVSDFAEGTTAGTSSPITGGKFLLRFEGFVVPDDAS